jgi:hypothetical protein
MSRRRRRIPSPVVLALASGMVSIGVFAWLAAEPAAPTAATPEPVVEVVDGDARGAAESYLDAWRKREHEVAIALSTGPARQAAIARRDADAALTEEEAAIKAQLWDDMASSRLTFEPAARIEEEGERVVLTGLARGDFLGRRYEREVRFRVAPHGSRWRVEEMILGPILSDLPDFLELGEPPGGHESPAAPEQEGPDPRPTPGAGR